MALNGNIIIKIINYKNPNKQFCRKVIQHNCRFVTIAAELGLM